VCDPPFLNEDCQTKGESPPNTKDLWPLQPHANNTNFAVALTIRWLARPAATKAAAAVPGSKPAFRMISCTGERMETLLVTKLYRSLGLRTTDYEPVHARCLNNEFYCYANFECDRWSWVAKDDQ